MTRRGSRSSRASSARSRRPRDRRRRQVRHRAGAAAHAARDGVPGRAREYRQGPDRVTGWCCSRSRCTRWPRARTSRAAVPGRRSLRPTRWSSWPSAGAASRCRTPVAASRSAPLRLVAFITVVASRTGGTASPLANLCRCRSCRGDDARPAWRVLGLRRRPARLALAARGQGAVPRAGGRAADPAVRRARTPWRWSPTSPRRSPARSSRRVAGSRRW